ncbi:MAG: transporter substrate-binding domain-containing protein [Caldilineaceae bacterium]|nr:transporter substrate-binding domain-containing protein [Caldilineaceae bacterium]
MLQTMSRRALALLVVSFALLLTACAMPAAPTTDAGDGADAAPMAAEGPGTAQVVYDLPDLAGRTIVAAMANDYTPFQFVDPASGEAVGWEYDAMYEICRRLNCTIDWQTSAWETMIPAVAEGQFDMGMDGITITEERAQQVDFSDPYINSQQFMLVRAGEDRFAAPEDFAADEALLVGAQAGTTGFYTAVYDILDGDEANPRIKLFDNFGASVQALLNGDVDLVLVDAASGRGYIGANPDALEIVGDALTSEEFGFIFTPGSDLVDPVNAAIASMQADGYLEYLNTKWFFLTDPNGEDVYDALPDLAGRTIVAAMANDYTPFQFVDPASGEAVGWEYDAMYEICRRLNCTIDWQTSAWETMIPAVAEGQFDMGMDGITITEERAQQVDFSAPYINSQQFMLVRAGEDRFAAPEDFAADEALLVGAQAGTTGFYTAVYDILDGDEANPRIKLFDNFGASVQALLNGDVDLVLVDAASGRGYIGANPNALEIVGDALTSEEFGFIFTPGSDLVDPVNAAIDSLTQDGYLEYLNTKWFFEYDPSS